MRDPDGKMCPGHGAWRWLCGRKRNRPTGRVPEKQTSPAPSPIRTGSGSMWAWSQGSPAPAEQCRVSSVCESPDGLDLVPLVSIQTGLASPPPWGAWNALSRRRCPEPPSTRPGPKAPGVFVSYLSVSFTVLPTDLFSHLIVNIFISTLLKNDLR